MPNKKKYDAVATVGEYTNKQGEKKKQYANVGVVFEDEQGRLSMKLTSVPCVPEWSGWISFYEPKEQGRDRTPADGYRQGSTHSSTQPRDNGGGEPDDGDIPFAAARNITHF